MKGNLHLVQGKEKSFRNRQVFVLDKILFCLLRVCYVGYPLHL